MMRKLSIREKIQPKEKEKDEAEGEKRADLDKR